MRLLVFGAGAVGSVTGGLMAKDGHDVTLIGRHGHMDAISKEGLRITGIWGDHHVAHLDVRTGLAGLGHDPFDLILLTVRAYQTQDAVEAIAPIVGDDTFVCSYQNGLGNAEHIAAAFGWKRCIDARVIFGARMPAPGRVDVTVTALPATLGSYEAEPPVERITGIAHAMDRAGVPTLYSAQIATDLWAKVAYNCALNPLSALLDVPYGGLLETDHAQAIMTEVIEELYTVGHAQGVVLDPPTAPEYRTRLFEMLIPATAEHYASTREDFRKKRRTEIDALNGAIVRFGQDHNIPCPANTTLTRLVRAREHTYLK